MLPIIFQQSKDYYKYFHFKISLEWIVQHKPYGYMYIYGCIKSVAWLSTVCGTSLLVDQTNFFDGNIIYFDYCAIIYLEIQNIQPFVLKSD